jgi:DNA-binding NtrC family response regulator
LLRQARKVAASEATALLRGETGTGKTTLARWLHEHGPRAGERFIAVSCATLPANLMESALFGHVKGAFTGAVADHPGSVHLAEGGTLFLDEIGDLPLELQPKLLTFLQEFVYTRVGDPRPRQADVRVIAATNDDLERRVAERSFRGDLYYRLAVLPLSVPPLRERREDILKFADFWLARRAGKLGGPPVRLAPDAAAALERHAWPGNLRELEHVLERAATFGDGAEIRLADLALRPAAPAAGDVPAGNLAGRTLEDIERQALLDTLAHCAGNKKAAARMLAIDEKSVYNKLRRLGLLPDHDPPPG